MTKRLKIFLLTISAAVCAACAAFAFAGCKIGFADRAETLAPYRSNVVYYGNGGYFNESTTQNVADLYFRNDPSMDGYNPDGIPFFDISESGGSMNIAYANYDLEGWYLPQTYKDGGHAGEFMYTYQPDAAVDEVVPVYPVRDKDGNAVHEFKTDRPVFAREGVDEQIPESKVRIVPSEQKVTSSRRIAADEKLTVCAKWVPTLRVEFILSCEDKQKEYEDKDGNKYKDGDVLNSVAFPKGAQTYSPSTREPLKLTGASFMRTYFDAELEKPIDKEALKRPAGENPENIKIYSRYLDGEWTVIGNDTSAIRRMFQNLDRGNYYLMEDVDCKNITINMNSSVTAAATIEGNKHVLSNLNFAVSGRAEQGKVYSVLGTLGETFHMKDLTLNGVNITARSGAGPFSLYALFGSAHESAQFTGVTVNDITATVTLGTGIDLYNAAGENRSSWICGGAANDEAYLSSHSGLKLTGERTLTKN